ncbi:hypothetical protein BDV95DRAFT_609308 [Massariosphaeria phaeospora]|uniref:Uncharacterized protein n=1 Tax=Massariosphaeria phaeospora TaxID=100035 RepID=A0A7C8MBK8_9PLEO|nr:hypothetical protein BDV95DRAFT_609308 [Massariosphaeria phaeospora]
MSFESKPAAAAESAEIMRDRPTDPDMLKRKRASSPEPAAREEPLRYANNPFTSQDSVDNQKSKFLQTATLDQPPHLEHDTPVARPASDLHDTMMVAAADRNLQDRGVILHKFDLDSMNKSLRGEPVSRPESSIEEAPANALSTQLSSAPPSPTADHSDKMPLLDSETRIYNDVNHPSTRTSEYGIVGMDEANSDKVHPMEDYPQKGHLEEGSKDQKITLGKRPATEFVYENPATVKRKRSVETVPKLALHSTIKDVNLPESELTRPERKHGYGNLKFDESMVLYWKGVEEQSYTKMIESYEEEFHVTLTRDGLRQKHVRALKKLSELYGWKKNTRPALEAIDSASGEIRVNNFTSMPKAAADAWDLSRKGPDYEPIQNLVAIHTGDNISNGQNLVESRAENQTLANPSGHGVAGFEAPHKKTEAPKSRPGFQIKTEIDHNQISTPAALRNEESSTYIKPGPKTVETDFRRILVYTLHEFKHMDWMEIRNLLEAKEICSVAVKTVKGYYTTGRKIWEGLDMSAINDTRVQGTAAKQEGHGQADDEGLGMGEIQQDQPEDVKD